MGVGESEQTLDAEAFKRLYPDQYFLRFLKENIRPDGRPLGRARPFSVSLGAVATADGSALVKIGNTTMLAAVKLEVMVPAAEKPEEGRITVAFEMPPLCSPLTRPGRPPDVAHSVTEQVSNALTSSGFVNLKDLCISPKDSAWVIYLDVYCLDADGSLLDAALLASVAALADLQIPAVHITDDGRVAPGPADTDMSDADGRDTLTEDDTERENSKRVAHPIRSLALGDAPVALTCGLLGTHLLVDISAEEEALMASTVSVVMSAGKERLISLYKPGGTSLASTAVIQACIEAARLRTKEISKSLQQAILEAKGTQQPS